jgi:hypothetical protein
MKRRALLAVLAAAVVGALATAAHPPAAGSVAARVSTGGVGNSRTSRAFVLPAGQSQRRFSMREPAGVILLTRITVPHGVHATVDARIPHLAGAGVSTATSRVDPALSCRRSGGDDVCTQAQEWCPMPAARWRMHLVKTGGPAGRIRVDFVVGQPPAGR